MNRTISRYDIPNFQQLLSRQQRLNAKQDADNLRGNIFKNFVLQEKINLPPHISTLLGQRDSDKVTPKCGINKFKFGSPNNKFSIIWRNKNKENEGKPMSNNKINSQPQLISKLIAHKFCQKEHNNSFSDKQYPLLNSLVVQRVEQRSDDFSQHENSSNFIENSTSNNWNTSSPSVSSLSSSNFQLKFITNLGEVSFSWNQQNQKYKLILDYYKINEEISYVQFTNSTLLYKHEGVQYIYIHNQKGSDCLNRMNKQTSSQSIQYRVIDYSKSIEKLYEYCLWITRKLRKQLILDGEGAVNIKQWTEKMENSHILMDVKETQSQLQQLLIGNEEEHNEEQQKKKICIEEEEQKEYYRIQKYIQGNGENLNPESLDGMVKYYHTKSRIIKLTIDCGNHAIIGIFNSKSSISLKQISVDLNEDMILNSNSFLKKQLVLEVEVILENMLQAQKKKESLCSILGKQVYLSILQDYAQYWFKFVGDL